VKWNFFHALKWALTFLKTKKLGGKMSRIKTGHTTDRAETDGIKERKDRKHVHFDLLLVL
jgi:hypothetical protein